MGRRGKSLALGVALLLAACSRAEASITVASPALRDVVSPEGLPPELALTRIPWWRTDGGEEGGYFLLVNGTDAIPAPAGCWDVSPDGRYLACESNFVAIEVVDVDTGEHRVLVKKQQQFPGAVALGFPTFTPDGEKVIFDVGWADHADLATVDVDTGLVEYIDAPGVMNVAPRVSPDGQRILVNCEGRQPGAGFVLCLIDPEARSRTYLVDEVLNLLPGNLFTPDGRSVVYVTPVGGIGGQGYLYRVDLDDGENHLLVSEVAIAGTVLGTTDQEAVFACRFPETPACSWVCVVNLDGTDVRRLTYLGEQCVDVNAP